MVLVVGVFAIPYYTGQPWFTKLCPQGALQGGIFQPLLHPELRAGIGSFWYIKQAILLLTVVAMIFILRPFCGVICPLGAFFSLFNRISAWQITYHPQACTDCGWCVQHCPMGLDPRQEVNGAQCISCLECQKCPHGAIRSHPLWQRQQLTCATDPMPTDPGGVS